MTLLPADDKSLKKAIQLVNDGGVIAFPTDTVYGVGVSAFNPKAIERLYRVKQRDHGKPIPVLIGELSDLEKLTLGISPEVEIIIQHFWPGALTLILPKKPGLPENLSSGKTLGIRQPDLNITLELLKGTGPMAVSSANLSGQTSARKAGEIKSPLAENIDLILDGGETPGGNASTVVHCYQGQLEILRPGPVTLEQLSQVLQD